MTGRLGAELDRRATSVEAYIKGATGWYAQLVPSHMDPLQFGSLLLNVLRKDPQLAEAAEKNPGSFRAAANECARLGGVPGVNFYFVRFNTKNGPEVTGIVGYQLEMEQAHKADPRLAAIICEVVRQGGDKPDLFRWSPNRMAVPEHEIQDDGLATAEERGPLRAVYCYGRYRDGSVSTCVVLRRDDVQKHRDVAKTDKFWGPAQVGGPVALELAWTQDMWRKTGVHKWSDSGIPRSPEFVQNLIRTATLVADHETAAPLDVSDRLRGPVAPSRPRLAIATSVLADDETPGPARSGDPAVTAPPGPGDGAKRSAPDSAGRAGSSAPPRSGAATRTRQPHVDQGEQGINLPSHQQTARGEVAGDEVRARVAERLAAMPMQDRDPDTAEALSWLTGRAVSVPADLDDREAEQALKALDALAGNADGDMAAAASRMWELYAQDRSRT